MSEKVILGVDEFNNLTNYLYGRPYREVNQLLEELRQSASIVEVPDQGRDTNPHDAEPPADE